MKESLSARSLDNLSKNLQYYPRSRIVTEEVHQVCQAWSCLLMISLSRDFKPEVMRYHSSGSVIGW